MPKGTIVFAILPWVLIPFKISEPNSPERVLKKPNCLSGFHRKYDGPKVSNLGRPRQRERNGISLRWPGACPLSEANATDKSADLGELLRWAFLRLMSERKTMRDLLTIPAIHIPGGD